MKKKVLALVLALTMALSLLPVTAMADSHVHVWDTAWTYSEEGFHWHECIASGCDLKSDIYGNDYNVYKDGYALCEYDANGNCVCGAVKPAHVHEWAAIPGERTTREHWCVCTVPGCPLESDTTTPGRIHNALHYKYKPHTFDREGYCAECNWKYTRHVHAWDETEYVHNENGHWYECTDSNCWIDNVEYNKAYAPHTLDRATGKCADCGYPFPKYTVTVEQNAGGTVNVQNTAFYDDTVPVTITPNPGCKVNKVQLKYNGTEIVDLTNATSFTMPAANVTLVVEFIGQRTPVGPAQGATYYVEHYVQEWNGSYTLVETEVLSGEIGTTVTADSTKYDSLAHHVNTAKSTLEGKVSFDLTAQNPMDTLLTLTVYYDQNSLAPIYDTTPEAEIVTPKTADAGIFFAVSMSIFSVTGSAVLLKKKED